MAYYTRNVRFANTAAVEKTIRCLSRLQNQLPFTLGPRVRTIENQAIGLIQKRRKRGVVFGWRVVIMAAVVNLVKLFYRRWRSLEQLAGELDWHNFIR